LVLIFFTNGSTFVDTDTTDRRHIMKVLVGLTLVSTFISITYALQQQNTFDETKEKVNFKSYFIKAFQLRFLKRDNNTAATGSKQVVSTRVISRRDLTPTADQLLQNSFNRYQQASKSENFIRVGKNGTTDEKLELIANEVWDRVGAEIVEKTFVTVGAQGASIAGGYVGGALGMAIGVAVPPLQIPLTIGGVFIGKNLGRVLGALAGKVSADFVNNLISQKVIVKSLLHPLYSLIENSLKKLSTSSEITCRSDICSVGSAEKKCKCIACNGPMQYSNEDGATACKQCSLGSYPVHNYYQKNYRCRKCPIGAIGKGDGRCYNCDGPMEYSDTEAAVSCKQCSLGSYPVHNYYQRNYRCRKCPIGKIGKADGRCYTCDGPMEYSDTEAAVSCKQCSVGQIPVRNYSRRPYKCSNCRKGTYGKDDGKCHKCDGSIMQYGDAEGATSCKTCPQGSFPRRNYYGYFLSCSRKS